MYDCTKCNFDSQHNTLLKRDSTCFSLKSMPMEVAQEEEIIAKAQGYADILFISKIVKVNCSKSDKSFVDYANALELEMKSKKKFFNKFLWCTRSALAIRISNDQ
ncbi:CLUMA_CG011276, isoform A [Clunio marinus]|uniref:CLUMA_CG011276, isoform A n=1 Tax=Clunio marinus TaxID=568069 RepID=A0A1J1IC88_9DIPT|nr:CLUMA_CG011276, isoform A [Clunio marinus]